MRFLYIYAVFYYINKNNNNVDIPNLHKVNLPESFQSVTHRHIKSIYSLIISSHRYHVRIIQLFITHFLDHEK